ncbi:MAG: cytochrome c [Planctomycetes bacterium]|nr:cytochrome c [Planctomycetota bacterium]
MKHSKPTWPRLALATLGALAAASCGSAEKVPAAERPQATGEPTVTEVVMMSDDEDEPVHDGKWLYERNCAGCHNANGDGHGPTMVQLGLEARDFKQGGFAFGNTREAIYRTITAGMPGSSVMPSFKVSLDEDERWMLADFVLTLCPAPGEPASGTRIAIGSHPQIARGLLPAVADGKPQWPRGILLGTPEGLTFEYRVDDVRLLAVRQGEFADRTDWNDRGGGELVPLGKAFYVPGGGDPKPAFTAMHFGNERPLAARLKSTLATRDALGLDCELVDKRGTRLASIEERLRVEALSIGGAFTRSFAVRGDLESVNVVFDLGATHDGGAWVRGEPTAWQQAGEVLRGAIPADGWLVGKRGDGFELVHVVADKNVKLVRDSESLHLFVPVFAGAEQVSASFAVTVIGASEWSEELLATLGKELAR